jgi:hypothetical protein
MRTRAAITIIVLLILLGLGASLLHLGESPARRRCKAAVVQAYENADKVFEQPSDLDGFCQSWGNRPPGYNLP